MADKRVSDDEIEEKPLYEDIYGELIYNGEKYYQILSMKIHERNLLKWARTFKRTAGEE